MKLVRWIYLAGFAAASGIVAAIPAAAEDLTRRQHGDWTVQCRPGRATEMPLCLAFTPLKTPTGAPVGILDVQPLGNQQLVTLSMNGGFRLMPEITLQIDGRAPYRHDGCDAQHCTFLLGADDPLQVLFRKGVKLQISGGASTSGETEFTASLMGYTAAQASWREMHRRPDTARQGSGG